VKQNVGTKDGRTGTGPWSYEMGVKVKVDQPMQLSAIRFWKSSQETGTHTGTVWTSVGTKLTSVTFAGESGSGWQQQALPTPLVLQPGSVYVVSVNRNSVYEATTSGLATQVISGPLRSVSDGKNGVYGASAGTFPARASRRPTTSPTSRSCPTASRARPDRLELAGRRHHRSIDRLEGDRDVLPPGRPGHGERLDRHAEGT